MGAGLGLPFTLVQSEQRQSASGARAAARREALVRGALGGREQTSVAAGPGSLAAGMVVAGDELEGASELGSRLGHETPVLAQLARQRPQIVVATLAARLHLGLEPGVLGGGALHEHAIQAELGHLTALAAHAPRQALLAEGQQRLERPPGRDLLDARAQVARRPFVHRHVHRDQHLKLLAAQHAAGVRQQLLEGQADTVAGLAPPQVVAAREKVAARRVQEGVAVVPALAGVHLAAGELRDGLERGERVLVGHAELGLDLHLTHHPAAAA